MTERDLDQIRHDCEVAQSQQRLEDNPEREATLPTIRVWNAGHYQTALNCEEWSAGADRELIPEPPKVWQRK